MAYSIHFYQNVVSPICLCTQYMTIWFTITGWMHHAVEQFGGRGTRDSFPLDGLNRGPWAPVGGRAWQPPARSVTITISMQS